VNSGLAKEMRVTIYISEDNLGCRSLMLSMDMSMVSRHIIGQSIPTGRLAKT
jgi:hypothetical protein